MKSASASWLQSFTPSRSAQSTERRKSHSGQTPEREDTVEKRLVLCKGDSEEKLTRNSKLARTVSSPFKQEDGGVKFGSGLCGCLSPYWHLFISRSSDGSSSAGALSDDLSAVFGWCSPFDCCF